MPEPIPLHTRSRITELARAGTTDKDIADTLKLHPSTVKRIRLAAGITRGIRASGVNVTPEQLAELHYTSDRAMYRKYGNNQKTWAKIRVHHGIPRFREPTTGRDAVVRAAPTPVPKRQPYGVSIAPLRERNLATEAADYLRRERWVVVNRAKVYGGDGWDVGRMRMSEAEMLEMATRRGFVREAWMC